MAAPSLMAAPSTAAVAIAAQTDPAFISDFLLVDLIFYAFHQPLFLPEHRLLNYWASIGKAQTSKPLLVW